MLAVWKAADDIDVFESGWTFDHFYPIFTDSTGPVPRGLGHPHRAGPGHDPAAPRRARHRHPLPPPGRAGQHGRHARHHLGRPARARASAPAGTRRSRAPTASSSAPSPSGSTASTRPARCITGLLTDRRHRPSPAATTSSPTPAASPSRCSSPTRRSASAAPARSARCRSPASPSTGTTPAAPPEELRASSTCSRALRGHRPRPGGDHDVGHLRLRDPTAKAGRRGGALAEAGLDLGIVYLPPPHDPAVLASPSPKR